MKKILLILSLISLILPLGALAVPIEIPNPLGATKLEDIIDNLINFIFTIAIIVVPLMIIIGGFLLATAGGNPQQIDRAKKLILWTLIGLAILLFAKGIVSVIKQLLGA